MQIDGMGVMSWPSARNRLVGKESADEAFARQLAGVRSVKDAAASGSAAGAAANAAAGNGTAGGTSAGNAVAGNGLGGNGATGNAATGNGTTSNGATGNGATDNRVDRQGRTVADTLNALTNAGEGTATKPVGQSEATAADVQDRFLKLLVAQMRNQDPLNPMDNAAVTSQMAQISTVQGIETLNKTLGDWVKTNGSGSALASAGLVGHDVLGQGESFNLDPAKNDGAQRLGFTLQGGAKSVQVDIVDAAGRVVNTRTLTDQEAGLHTFQWDGRDANGSRVSASPLSLRVAASSEGRLVQSTPLVPRRVVGVSQTASGAQVQFQDGGSAAATDIPMVL